MLNDATLAPAVVWLLALALASLTVRRWAGPWSWSHPVLAIAAAAAMARAVPMVVLDRGLPFDIEAHWWIGSLALAGRDVYTDPLAPGPFHSQGTRQKESRWGRLTLHKHLEHGGRRG